MEVLKIVQVNLVIQKKDIRKYNGLASLCGVAYWEQAMFAALHPSSLKCAKPLGFPCEHILPSTFPKNVTAFPSVHQMAFLRDDNVHLF